jgi:acyl-CoA thioesterase YciA
MFPHETNGMGNIFGGVLLSYMDHAGQYTAQRACGSKFVDRCVTRFMDRVEFKQPVKVNDVITCWGSVVAIGETSIKVHVEVEADRAGKIIPVTSADLVFVAVDEHGKPTTVACSTSGSSTTCGA